METKTRRAQRPKPNYAFIDSQNLNLGVRAQGWRLDWTKFKSYLQSQWKVSKAFLFIGYIEEQEEMYTQLRKMGYTLVFKPTVVHGEEVKGNVDVELVLHMMTEWNNYNQAIIISGDGDFYSLVKHLIEKQKLAALVVPNRRRFSSLYAEVPEKHLAYMDSLRSALSYRPSRPAKPNASSSQKD